MRLNYFRLLFLIVFKGVPMSRNHFFGTTAFIENVGPIEFDFHLLGSVRD